MVAVITYNTKIQTEVHTKAIEKAIANLVRDIKKACCNTNAPGAMISLVKGEQERECFHLGITSQGVTIEAKDELGFIYGIYEISKRILGIQPFWFWNDQVIEPKESYTVEEEYQSSPYPIRFRGWFINDEVLIQNWTINGKKEIAWEMAFEALLRCGGNMIIPGTDRNAELHKDLAVGMGLYITHHHSQPLGAEMFSRVYPDLLPSYAEQKDKFIGLWQKAITNQKEDPIIWTLGFRGQGDCPFWSYDSKYQTEEARGALMSKIIKLQYDMVQKEHPDSPCCTNLYGETMELYNEGYLNIPDNVIKIWADNGYGKMVTRRQDNHNPRVNSLPRKEDSGSNGIYYHVSFYDLQAANHITMLPNSPGFIGNELEEVINHRGNDFWLINCSNVKPHVYFLDLVATLWKEGTIDCNKHRMEYVRTYYGEEGAEQIAKCFEEYPDYAVAYGPNQDDHAGEQFTNHVARILVSQYMREKTRPAEELKWATDALALHDQIHWYQALCKKGKNGYKEYRKQCEATALSLPEAAETLFRDSLLLQVQIHEQCYLGAYHMCESLLFAEQGQYEQAFYQAGKARKAYIEGNVAMRQREHGKWSGFYKNECLTDVKQTAWVLEGLMSYLRNLGDGPHFYKWQREFLYPEEDRKIMLLLNYENHLTDQELFQLMEQKLGK